MAEEIKADTAKPPKAENPKPKAGAGIDIASIGGLALALGGILGGLLIEGGRLKDVAQFTAAMIVLGGTIGAVMISTPLPIVIGAAKRFAGVFCDRHKPMNEVLEQVIGYATKARKNGLVSRSEERRV